MNTYVCPLIFIRIERTNRLFLPSNSDDVSHDEALANRIAALNMLDLGWEHLGVEMENGGDTSGIDKVALVVGEGVFFFFSKICVSKHA